MNKDLKQEIEEKAKELKIIASEIRIFSQVCKDDLNSKESKDYIENRITELISNFTLQFVKDKEDRIKEFEKEKQLLKQFIWDVQKILFPDMEDREHFQSAKDTITKIQSLTEENRLLKEKISRDLEAQSATVNAYEEKDKQKDQEIERLKKENAQLKSNTNNEFH